jgi:CRISP-associated protein Cas1
MIIKRDGDEISRIPLDDILAVIANAHGLTYSNSLLVQLATRGSILVVCGANHFPVAFLGAIEGNHAQGGRIDDQISAARPLKKQIWKNITIQKIRMQAATLKAFGENDVRLEMLTREVKSGDITNIEAQAARHYWPKLMGSDFKRDRSLGGANAMLNYGYTILRAAVARSVIATGLHPSIGIHHKNRTNSFSLVDDLMEPFRPLVDYTVRILLDRKILEVEPDTKRVLAAILDFDLNMNDNRSPVTTAIQHLSQSLAFSFAQGRSNLSFAKIPQPIEFSALGLLYDVQT